MTQETQKCPCCGSEVDALKILISDDGLVSHRGKTVYLSRVLMRIFKAFFERYPNGIFFHDLIDEVWNDARIDTTRENTLRVQISKLRGILSLIDIGIENQHGGLYGLKIGSDYDRYLAVGDGELGQKDCEACIDLFDRGYQRSAIAAKLKIPYKKVEKVIDDYTKLSGVYHEA